MHEGKLLSSIRSAATILAEEYEDNFVIMTATIPDNLAGACAPFVEAAP